MLRDESYVVFDFETTGLSPRHGEVVEAGAVCVESGRLGGEFHAMCRPEQPIPARVIAIHGITDRMVEGEPRFTSIVGEFLDFLGDRTLVAHHARFDGSFLDAAVDRVGLRRPDNPVLDTVRLSRRLFPEMGRHDLASLCATHRIRRAIAHRALDDARATAELLLILLERAEQSGLSLAELRFLGRPGRWRQGRRLRPITLRPEERVRLQDAAIVGERVALGYLSQRGKRRLLTVVPYTVDPTADVPRLVAYDVAAGRTRIWPLDRVVSVAAVEERP